MELINKEEKERIVDLIFAYMDREKDIDVCIDILKIAHKELGDEFQNIDFENEDSIAEIKSSYTARISTRNNPWEPILDGIIKKTEIKPQKTKKEENLETVYFLCEIYKERHPELNRKSILDIFNLLSECFSEISKVDFENFCRKLDSEKGEER